MDVQSRRAGAFFIAGIFNLSPMENEPEPAHKHTHICGNHHYAPPTREVRDDYSNEGINHVSPQEAFIVIGIIVFLPNRILFLISRANIRFHPHMPKNTTSSLSRLDCLENPLPYSL